MAIIDSVKKRITGKGSQKKDGEKVSDKISKKKELKKAPKVKKSSKVRKRFYQLVERPIVTEKATDIMGDGNAIILCVAKIANKAEIKKVCEKYYGSKVSAVNIINQPSKARKRGAKEGRKSGYKKAIIKFTSKIDI